ncbi:hypothetical protein Tco_0625429 [Tanacetum coccineum]|uniref:Retrovirus-related Pol polyprotein from transposon TNT 1-94-like beta-barrel domain-containing protein n=1 Tax=Tanacetum coccineum TaxID=301880 RepID=A0ABQ4WGS2_9ASTR
MKVPYPLSANSDCGNTDYTLRCDTHSQKLYFDALNGSSYLVVKIKPESKMLVIQSQPWLPNHSRFSRYLCHQYLESSGRVDPARALQNASTVNPCCTFIAGGLPLAYKIHLHASGCKAFRSIIDLDYVKPASLWEGVEIQWAPPPEPVCKTQLECSVSSKCKPTNVKGVSRCLCLRHYDWDNVLGVCRKRKHNTKFNLTNKISVWTVLFFPVVALMTTMTVRKSRKIHQKAKVAKEREELFKSNNDMRSAIDNAISDEDQEFLLLTSLSSSYDSFVETLLYGRDTLKLEDVLATLNSRELQKMTEAKGDGGEGLYSEEYLKRDCPKYNHKKSQGFVRNKDQVFGSGADGYDNADVMMAMSVEELLDWIMDSGSLYYITYMRDYLVDFKEYDGGNILIGDGKECRVRGTGKVQVQMRDGSSFMLDNVRSPSSAIGFMTPIDMLGFFGWLASIKQGMLEPVKVKCIFLGHRKGIVGNKLWRFDDVTSKVVLYRNIGFNESWEYKKTFIGYGVGTGSMQVLQGVVLEVEPKEDHTFEVEPHGNVNHVVGSQAVQTQDLIYYHPARDREQHSAWELFSYREDSNEAAFAVAAVKKIYVHESLSFNNTVACEVISKWKAGLKDDMDARSDVYVLSNCCKKCSDDSDAEIWATKGLLDKAKGNVLSMEIVRDQSGNTLRSIKRDCDVEKNGKWSCIYAVGSQEYQMVCTRLDIAFADVDMLDKFDRGLQTDI